MPIRDLDDYLPAWLEDAHGKRLPIGRSCLLGRSERNQVVVPDKTVSRRHALMQLQGEREYWIVDFGSRNGTYLNGQRLSRPTRVRDGDALRIGSASYVFHQDDTGTNRLSATLLNDRTLMDVRAATCWLLVADIIDSTQLTTTLSPDMLPLVVGKWMSDCQEVIEAHGGRINQFLGDGFFAYWQEHGRLEPQVQGAVAALCRMQERMHPKFRFVLHRAEVTLGGITVGEEENISGPDVHLVFRLEKLAGALGVTRLISEAVREPLAKVVQPRSAGAHALPGFEGTFPVYTF